MFYSSFITFVLAFVMFMGYQGQEPEFYPEGDRPDFTYFSESQIPYDYEKVSIEIFDTLNCTNCSEFALKTLPDVRTLSANHDQLEVRLFFIPDSSQPIQYQAAMALKCASDQNAFWDMHQKIHSNANQLHAKSFIQFSTELGLDLKAMSQCQQSQIYEQAIESDLQYAKEKGVIFKPSLFINQYRMTGHQPIENIKRIVQRAEDDLKREPVHSTLIQK